MDLVASLTRPDTHSNVSWHAMAYSAHGMNRNWSDKTVTRHSIQSTAVLLEQKKNGLAYSNHADKSITLYECDMSVIPFCFKSKFLY